MIPFAGSLLLTAAVMALVLRWPRRRAPVVYEVRDFLNGKLLVPRAED